MWHFITTEDRASCYSFPDILSIFFEKPVMEAGKSPTEANLTESTSDRKSIRPCVRNMTEKKELKIEEMRTKRGIFF